MATPAEFCSLVFLNEEKTVQIDLLAGVRSDSPMRTEEFVWGVATSSYQIEGAVDLDGRIDSIWDSFCGQPGKILDASSGAEACDHYHRYLDDLDLIKSLGFTSYRFSVAWPRVLDEQQQPNEAGLAFYERLINAMLERDLEPMLTLYHWDLPDYLQHQGGWSNPEVPHMFASYARLLIQRFGDRVSKWSTLNEPWCSSFLSFDLGLHAPGMTDRYEALRVGRGLLLGHGLAIAAMRREKPDAELGVVINPDLVFAASDSASDKLAAERAQTERNDFWMNPLTGQCPPACLDLPQLKMSELFSESDLLTIAQPLDFIGINFYTRSIVKVSDNIRGYEPVIIPDVERTHIGWEVYPDALESLLKLLHQNWPMPAWYITENGAATDDALVDGECDDQQRQRYFQSHLAAVDCAQAEGVPVKGYYAWSLMDNFEWAEGYTQRFGIVYVDYETQRRYPKGSALAFKRFLTAEG